MLFYITKVLFTSVIIVLVTEIAKRSDKLGGLCGCATVDNNINYILDVF